MTGGTEVQEQGEVQEQPKEVSEETRRVDQATTEPETVVEQERSVDESEAIEAAVVEVVEAAETAADGGPGTGDREEAAEAATGDGGRETESRSEGRDEEVTATPIPIPGEGLDTDPETVEDQVRAEEEVTATPIPIPGEGLDPDPETAEDQVQGTERVQDRGDSAASPEAAEQMVDPEELVQQPGRETEDRQTEEQQGRGEGEREGEREQDTEPPGNVVDEERSSDPEQPRDENGTEQAAGERQEPGDSEPGEEISATTITLPKEDPDGIPDTAEDLGVEVIQEEAPDQPESESRAEGDPGREGEQDDEEEQLIHGKVVTDQEVGSEVLEGEEPGGEWEESSGETPPVLDVEAEVLEGEEGEETEKGPDSPTDQLAVEDPASVIEGESEAGPEDIEKYWEVPDDMYIFQKKDGTIEFVDSKGNPIDSPPIYHREEETGEVKAWYPGGKNVKAFEVPEFRGYPKDEIFFHIAKDGTKTVVDKDGNPVNCQPELYGDFEGKMFMKGPKGEKIQIQEYSLKIEEFFVYTDQDGTKMVVDQNGNPVKSQPFLYGDPEEGTFIKGNEGKKIKVKEYVPPLDGIYVYTAQDGSKSIVDKNGKLISSPPIFFSDPEMGVFTKEKIKIPEYQPPLKDVYVYTAQDGTKTVVDKDGNPVESPPPIWSDQEMSDGAASIGPEGNKVKIEAYKPPEKDIYFHTAQDGTKTIVDKYGVPLKCPPIFFDDPEQGVIMKNSQDEIVKIPSYKPFSSKLKE